MKKIVLGLMLVSLGQAISNPAKEVCSERYEKIGCFHDRHRRPRPLPELLVTDRDPSDTDHYSGQMFRWNDFHNSIQSLLYRCAVVARSKGYRYIGLQFYAECWSGPESNKFAQDDPSTRCVDSFDSALKKWQPCSMDNPLPCVGEANTNFVYSLNYCWEEVDIGILLDVSNSMEHVLHTSRFFLNSLIDGLPISKSRTHLGLITFSDTAKVLVGLNDPNSNDPEKLKEVITGINEVSRGTYVDTALHLANTNFFTVGAGMRNNVPKVLITVSEGNIHVEAEPYYKYMDPLEIHHGVSIMAVGVGQYYVKEIAALARNKVQNAFDGNQKTAGLSVAKAIMENAKSFCSSQSA